jgi:putative DNA primase/helicase
MDGDEGDEYVMVPFPRPWPLDVAAKEAADLLALTPSIDECFGLAPISEAKKEHLRQLYKPHGTLPGWLLDLLKRTAKKTAAIVNAAIVLLNANEVEPEPIDWLWKRYLAKRKLHIFAGAPETGKTTLALSYAAIISAGERWPDGTRTPVGNVLIWTSEDGIADTIIPRLTRMGADLKRIKIIHAQRDEKGKERPFNPSVDMTLLVETALALPGGVSLLILDPVVAAIPATKNSHNNTEIRSGLQPVVCFAEEANAAVIGITHFTKGTAGKDPIERVTGSRAFGALPRIVMATAKNNDHADEEPPRIMVLAKSNIGPSGGGFGYDIDAAPLLERPDIIATRIVWLDPLDGTAKELLADAEGDDTKTNSKIEQAVLFLKAALAKGERPQTEIETEAESNGISEKTLRRAKKAVGVTAYRKVPGIGAWLWRLG